MPPVPATSGDSATHEAPKPAEGSAPTTDEHQAGEGGAIPSGTSHPDPAHDEYHHHDEYHDPHQHDPHHDYHYDEYHHQHHDHHAGESGGAGYASGGHPPEEPVDPLYAPDEDGGGPIKSFLEHLEDFRWVIIKCATAILVTMTVCLLGANYLVAVLKWPLKRAAHITTDKRQYVSVEFGPKQVMYFRTTNNAAIPGFLLPTNKFVELRFAPVTITNDGRALTVLSLKVSRTDDELPPDRELPLVYKSPADPFLASLKIGFFGGLLIALPVVLFFIAQFIFPALKPRELKYLKKAIYPATALFITGLCLCYFVILPLALKAAEQYSNWMGVEMQFWHADDYFSFCTKFMLGMGLGFEMPVILLALVKIGLLDHKKLASWRRYMVLINLILGALLTTPEVLTQVLMFVPLQFLYEVTIWVAWYWEQENRELARKRAVFVVGGIIIAIELIWLAIQFGVPWLRQHGQ